MRNTRFAIPAALLALSLTACGDPAANNAKSIHVDSSNVNGTAPVRYGPDDPADTVSDLPPGDDTGRRSNTSTTQEKGG